MQHKKTNKKNTFKYFFQELMKDERGAFSIKPAIACLGTLCLLVSLFVSGFTEKEFQPTDSIVEAVMIITIMGMGADTLDKFSFKKRISEPEEIDKTPEV
jgi:hypothetical protein